MTSSAGITRTPYLLSVAPRVCRCSVGAMELGRARTVERAEQVISGYWNVYIAFYGDQIHWLEWLITDLRDGRMVWRNGRRIPEEGTHGTIRQLSGSR